MRIIVTGGAGFIGTNLCTRLLAEGHHVVAMDDFSSGKRSNIAPLMDHDNFEFFEHDVRDPFDCTADRIYNLACIASPKLYGADPVKTLTTSVIGVQRLLDGARETGARLLHASTSEVYGDPHVHPQREDYWGNVNPIGPRSCYDEGKRCAETLCMDYKRTYGVDARLIRIFNTYGPMMASGDGRVMPAFITQALRDEPLTVQGDGSQTRSFCFVDDMVSGLIALMEVEPAPDGPINVGQPEEVTIRALAERIIEVTGSKSEIIETPLPADDPVRRKPDITRANEILSWSPKVRLADGLTKTIDWFAKTMDSDGDAGHAASTQTAAKGHSAAASGDAAALSVIVPSCNEETVIGQCLDSLLAQVDLPAPMEVIVAGNACVDDTVSVARARIEAFAARGWRLEVLDLPGGGKTGAMNAGEAASTAPARAFLDADVVCAPELIRDLMHALDSEEPVYASGTLIIPEPASGWSKAYARAWLRLPFVTDTVPGSGLYAVNAQARKRWGEFPKTFADDLMVRLLFDASERVQVNGTFSWPVPEGLNDLVRTRRRQNHHVKALLETYPDLAEKEDKTALTFGRAFDIFRKGPLDFMAYAIVVLGARMKQPKGSDHRAQRVVTTAAAG